MEAGGVEPDIDFLNRLWHNGFVAQNEDCVAYRVIYFTVEDRLDWTRFHRKRERKRVQMRTIDLKMELGDDELVWIIEPILRRLYITGKLKGFRYLTAALVEVVREEDTLRYMTKELYPQLAKRFGTTASCIERCIRNAIEVSWRRGGGKVFCELCGVQLEERPTNSEFLDYLAAYVKKQI